MLIYVKHPEDPFAFSSTSVASKTVAWAFYPAQKLVWGEVPIHFFMGPSCPEALGLFSASVTALSESSCFFGAPVSWSVLAGKSSRSWNSLYMGIHTSKRIKKQAPTTSVSASSLLHLWRSQMQGKPMLHPFLTPAPLTKPGKSPIPSYSFHRKLRLDVALSQNCVDTWFMQGLLRLENVCGHATSCECESDSPASLISPVPPCTASRLALVCSAGIFHKIGV